MSDSFYYGFRSYQMTTLVSAVLMRTTDTTKNLSDIVSTAETLCDMIDASCEKQFKRKEEERLAETLRMRTARIEANRIIKENSERKALVAKYDEATVANHTAQSKLSSIGGGKGTRQQKEEARLQATKERDEAVARKLQLYNDIDRLNDVLKESACKQVGIPVHEFIWSGSCHDA